MDLFNVPKTEEKLRSSESSSYAGIFRSATRRAHAETRPELPSSPSQAAHAEQQTLHEPSGARVFSTCVPPGLEELTFSRRTLKRETSVWVVDWVPY